MNLQYLVGAIVRKEVWRNKQTRKNAALSFSFDVRMHSFEEQDTHLHEFRESRGLHLLYHTAFPGSERISVFSGITDSPFGKLQDVKEWKHNTTHDTCWRDVNLFSSLYFDLAERINAKRVEKGLKEIPPKDMTELVSFAGLNGDIYSWRLVDVTNDPEDDRNYRKLIKILE